MLFAFLLLSLVPGRVAAQVQLSRLDGVVVDAANRPVAAAAVIVSNPLGATIRRVSVDSSGRFLIGDLPPGRYQLTVDAGGAVSPGVSVAVADGLPASVTLRLPPAFRDAVVVEGVRPAASIATRTSLGADSIARTPVRAGSSRLQDVVATLPGWATEDNGLLHSRGVDDGFLYVVDGVPVYERLDRTSGVAPDARRSTRSPSSAATCRRSSATRPAVSSRCGPAPRRARGAACRDRRRQRRRRGGRRRGRRPLGRGATLWLHAGGERSSRYLDPVDPDNLHNRGGGLSTAGQFTPGPARAIASRRAGTAAARVSTCRTRPGRKMPARRSGNGGTGRAHRLLAARWSGRRSRSLPAMPGAVDRGSTQRIRHAADGDIRSSPDADRRPRRRHAPAGAHVVKAGGELQQLRLAEQFGFAVTDVDAAAGAGLSEAALAFTPDAPFRFDGQARPALSSAYVQDTWQATDALTVAAGVRFDRTRVLLPRQQWSPRLGAAFPRRHAPRFAHRSAASISRRSPSTSCWRRRRRHVRCRRPSTTTGRGRRGRRAGAPVGRRSRRRASVRPRPAPRRRLVAREVDEYADPNVFFGTTIVFPNAVAEGRARGVDARLEFAPGGAWSGYGNVASARSRKPVRSPAASSSRTTSTISGPAWSSCPITISGSWPRRG